MKTGDTKERGRDWFALAVAHCAGLVDLVAMPLWVGVLISHHRLDPQQAGLLVTLFLLGCVAASLALAPRFARMRHARQWATGGFAVAALAFGGLGLVGDWLTMMALHVVGGLAVGVALTMTHGTQGRSHNPHRVFAVCSAAMGVWALLFLGTMPQVIKAFGGPSLFPVLAGVMGLAALCCAALFPSFEPASTEPAQAQAGAAPSRGIPRVVWGGVVGLALMALVQSTSFSFLERAGSDFGFTTAAIAGVLITLGLVNLTPAALAGLLQKRLNPRTVMLASPAAQALLVVLIFVPGSFPSYAFGAAFLVFTVVFAHVFAFGVLAQLDPSGRVLAATPAIMMSGAALGPLVAGTLVKFVGYPGIGFFAVVVASLGVYAFSRMPRGEVTPALPLKHA